MKRIQMLHKKAFWVTMFAALPLPFLVAAQVQRTSKIEEYVRIERKRQEAIEQRIGPDANKLIPLQSRKRWETASSDGYILRVLLTSSFPGAALTTSPLNELVTCLKEETGDLIQQFAEAGQHAVFHSDSNPLSRTNYLSTLQWRDGATFLCGLFARQAAAAGRMHEAIHSAGQALSICDSMRAQARSVPWRLGLDAALETYGELLRHDMKPDDCRAAIQQLESFATHLAEPMGAALPANFPEKSMDDSWDNSMTLTILSSAVYNAYERAGRIPEGNYGGGHPVHQAALLPWTAAAGHLVHLRRVSSGLHTPPDELVEAVVPGASRDPKIRALQFFNADPTGYYAKAIQARRWLSRARVLQTAYAARAHFLTNGKWPESIEVLEPAIAELGKPIPERTVPGVDDWERNIINMSQPFGQVKIGMIPLGQEELEAFIGMPFQVYPQHGHENEGKVIITPTEDGNQRLHAELFYSTPAMPAWGAFRRIKAMNEAFATTATLSRRDASADYGMMPAMGENFLIADPTNSSKCDDFLKTDLQVSGNETLRLEAEAIIPREAFAVWIDVSPIPAKGNKHGYYPPTGRIIVFPQQIF